MNIELFEQVQAYTESMAVARRLLNAGLITRQEFLEIEELIARKHNLAPRSIHREIT